MVYLVRSEDRRPSKRVFPLLQNLDLDTVTFANIQSVGDPITIQDMNEQEMYDLVLVNLARLVCSGEWDGLLSAGGGGISLPNIGTTNEDQYLISNSPFWGTTEAATSLNITSADFGKCLAFPFISPLSGTLSDLSVQVSVAGSGETTMYVGIYSENAAYLPGTLLIDRHQYSNLLFFECHTRCRYYLLVHDQHGRGRDFNSTSRQFSQRHTKRRNR